MKLLRYIAVITLLILVQIFLVAQFTLRPVNLAKIPYRQAERGAAYEALAHDPSPENKADLHQELQLASRHVGFQQFTLTAVVLAGIFSFEGLLIYLGRKHDDKHKVVA